MDAMITKRNELLAQKVIKGLASRNMTGYYAADREEALKTALSLIPLPHPASHSKASPASRARLLFPLPRQIHD